MPLMSNVRRHPNLRQFPPLASTVNTSPVHSEERLLALRRRLSCARLVAITCAALLLVVVNTGVLAAKVSFALAAVLILVGGVSLVLGVRASLRIPELEARVASPAASSFESLRSQQMGEVHDRTDA